MSEQTQGHFEGWAILEIFGHQKYAGYVTTQVFGTASLFRCDVPELKERERASKRGAYLQDGTYAPPGSLIKEGAVPGYSKLFGVGAIYAMTPCTQEACLKAVEEIQPRPLMLVSLPVEKALAAALPVCGNCGDPLGIPNAEHPGVCADCAELFDPDEQEAPSNRFP